MKVSANTKLLGIIGHPIEHSKSPEMHKAFADLIGEDFIYTTFDVLPQDLADAMQGVKALGIRGVNITSPHKFEIMNYLDEISDDAKKFGSVNTVVNDNGKLIGYNTDAQGFLKSLEDIGCTVENKDIIIFGSGGATQPIVILFAMRGAKSITVINRTKSKAESLQKYVKNTIGFEISTEIELSHYDIAINTTTCGMAPQIGISPTDRFDLIDETSFAADMIYNPEKTEFLLRAEDRGAKVVNGFGMLIYQGILAFELFCGKKLPKEAYKIGAEAVCDE